MARNNPRTIMKKIAQIIFSVAAAGIVAAGLTGCYTMTNIYKGTITKADFGSAPDGTPVEIYTLRNTHGMEAKIMTYGGIVTSLKTPDRNGNYADVVLGYDNLDGYLKSSPYFGALIGRYGNRIAFGKFTLDGNTYTMATNNGANTLHGGLKGFDKVVWTAKPMPTDHGPALILTYISKGGEEGFPGNLAVTAIYTVTEDNELRLQFTATTGRCLRGLARWMALATTSLPVPVSPVISTVARRAPTRRMIATVRSMAGLEPIRSLRHVAS